jgi:hypothetical protein
MKEVLENRNAVSTLIDALGSIAVMGQTSSVPSTTEKESGQVVKRDETATTRAQNSRVHLGTTQGAVVVSKRRFRPDAIAARKTVSNVSRTEHFHAKPSASADFVPQVLHVGQSSNAARRGPGTSSGVSSSAQPSPGPLAGNASRPAQSPQLTALAANDADDIRPMALAPTPDDGAASARMTLEPLFDSGGSGGSGGGDPPPPPDKAPILSASGGSWGTSLKKDGNGNPIPGEYEVVHGAPVGSIAVLQVSSPAAGYIIDTVAWSGGTDVSAYLAADPAAAPPETVTVEHDVPNDELTYRFIIDAKARNYHITVEVTYLNHAAGSTTLDFTSVRPAVATLTADTDPTPDLVPNDPGKVYYWDAGAMDGATGMVLKADTQASQYFGGDFMIMQIAYINRSYVDQNNNPKTKAGGPLIDDGVGGGLPLGMDLVNFEHSWHLTSQEDDPEPTQEDPNPEKTSLGDSGLDQATDVVAAGVPDSINDKTLTVGTPGPNPPDPNNPPVPEKFKTFLMYKPDISGVWVALAKVEWGWGIQIQNQGGVWQVVPNTTQDPVPTQVSPIPNTDDDFWPVWDGKTSDLDWQ